jgi:hypothetical protein
MHCNRYFIPHCEKHEAALRQKEAFSRHAGSFTRPKMKRDDEGKTRQGSKAAPQIPSSRRNGRYYDFEAIRLLSISPGYIAAGDSLMRI